MNQQKSVYRSLPKYSFLACTIFLLCCSLVCVAGIILRPPLAHADGVPGGNIADPTVRAIDLAKPAIVRIITTLGGHLTVHFSDTQSASFPRQGGNYKLQVSGSGAFISAHGDILTADHVVKPPHDSQIDQFLYEVASQDIADYVNTHFNVNPPFSKDDVVASLLNGSFRADTAYASPSSEVFLSTDYTGSIDATTISGVPSFIHARVDAIKAESSPDNRDTAIIHVNMNDTPSIPLGDSSNVEQQDNLTIIGFPGNGDVSQRNDPTTVLTSSVNRIYVSSLKKSDNGAPLIQVGGNIEHGDSGGPALDANGNIVGVVSFGLADTGSTAFLQASNTARDMVTSLNLDTKPGPLEGAWRQAFADYSSSQAGHWHRAESDFQRLITNHSDFKAAGSFLTYTSIEANHEKIPATSSPNLALLALLCLLVTAIVVGLILFLVLRRKPARPAVYGMPQPIPPHGFVPPDAARPMVPYVPQTPAVPPAQMPYPQMYYGRPVPPPYPQQQPFAASYGPPVYGPRQQPMPYPLQTPQAQVAPTGKLPAIQQQEDKERDEEPEQDKTDKQPHLL